MSKAIRRILPALLLSLAACLIFCENNTPLGASVGSDNAMYLTMGTALARGYAPYTQIFDHKGPLLFLLETIPQLFFGGYQTVTVFLMEWAFLFLSLLAVDRLCAQCGAERALPAQLAYLAVMMPCMSGGNLSEEYANLFTLAGLCLLLRAFGESEERRPFLSAAGMGLLSMLAFLTRANNALPLLFAVAALSVCLLAGRDFARLGACAAGFALGAAGAFLPVALWLSAKGALAESFYGAIVHNMLYANTGDTSRVSALLFSAYGHMAMLMAAVTAAGALCCFLRTRRPAVPLAMLALALGAGLAAFISHKFYMHYLMLGAPGAALGAAQLLRFMREKKPSRLVLCRRALSLVCCAALLAGGYAANARRLSDLAGMDRFAENARALYAIVPEDERDSFMAYRVEPKWYVYTGALPCMRFYFLQEILGQADPRVMDEIAATFESDPPRWLVIFHDRPFSPPYDARVQAVFDSRYEFVDAKGEYQLLRLKE